MKRFLVVAASAVLMMFSGARSASAITYTNFTPQGSWALVDNGAVAGGLESLSLFYSPTGYVDAGGNVDFINSVAIKVSSDIGTGSTLHSTTAPGVWVYQSGGLSNGGCDGSGSGFACAQDGTSALVTGSYEWVFYLNLAGNSLLTGTNASSIKAQFMDSLGANGNILSRDITLQGGGPGPGSSTSNGAAAVPEPASLMLLGSGLAFASARFRRKKKS